MELHNGKLKKETLVTLLAADAMTGATPISFFAPKD